MADINTLMDNTLPQTNRSARSIRKSYTFPSTGIGSGDNVQLYTVPTGTLLSLHSASLIASGSLGANAVLTLQVNRGGTRTAITGGTTAGAASKATSGAVAAVPFDLLPGDILEVAVSGAGVTVSAVVVFDILVVQR